MHQVNKLKTLCYFDNSDLKKAEEKHIFLTVTFPVPYRTQNM